MVRLELLRDQIQSGRYRLTLHAQVELHEDGFVLDDLENAFADAALVEDYPDAQRGACCLLSGLAKSGRPIHIVCTYGGELTVIISVYEPKPPKWLTPTQRGARK